MKKITFFLTFCLLTLLSRGLVFAQQQSCNDCSIFPVGSSSYTLTSGQTGCILPGQSFTGSIVLNGGTLVNCGTLSPSSIAFYAGEIINNDSAYFQSLTFNGPNTVFRNYGKAIFSSITLAGGEMFNYNSLTFNNNLLVYTAVKNFYNTGNITIQGDLTNYSDKGINEGNILVTGSYNNNYTCILKNSGLIQIGGNYSDIGVFDNSGKLIVQNYSQINGGAYFIMRPYSEFESNTLSIIGNLNGDADQCTLLKINTSVSSNWGAVISGKINVCTQGTVNFAPYTQGPDVVMACDCVPPVPADYLDDLSSFAAIAGNQLHSPHTLLKGSLIYGTATNIEGHIPGYEIIGPGAGHSTLINKLSLTLDFYLSSQGQIISSSDLFTGQLLAGTYHINENLNISNGVVKLQEEGKYVIVVHGNLNVTDVVLESENYTKNIVWIVSGEAHIVSERFGGLIAAVGNIVLGSGAEGNYSLFSLQSVTNNSTTASITASGRNLRPQVMDCLLVLSFNSNGTYTSSHFQTQMHERVEGKTYYGHANFRYNLNVDLLNVNSSVNTNVFNQNINYGLFHLDPNRRSNIQNVICSPCSEMNMPCEHFNTYAFPSTAHKYTSQLTAPRQSDCDQFSLSYRMQDINFDYISSNVRYTIIIGIEGRAYNTYDLYENFTSVQSCHTSYSGVNPARSNYITYANGSLINFLAYDEVISDKVLSGGKIFQAGKKYAFIQDVEFTDGVYFVQSGAQLFFPPGQRLTDCSTPPNFTCCVFKPLGITLRNASLVSNGGEFRAISQYWSGIALDNSTNIEIELVNTKIHDADRSVYISTSNCNALQAIQKFRMVNTSFNNIRNQGIDLNSCGNGTFPIVNTSNSIITGCSFMGIANTTHKTGINLGSSNLTALTVTGNIVTNVSDGIVSYGGMNVSSNVLSQIRNMGIVSTSQTRSLIRSNNITINTTGNPVGLFLTDHFECTDNLVNGAVSSTNAARNYGAILAIAGNTATNVFSGNRITNCEIGAELYGIEGSGIIFSGNYIRAVESIRKSAWPFSISGPVSIQCNTFEAYTFLVPSSRQKLGIYVAPDAFLPTLGSPTNPNGNRFLNQTFGIRSLSNIAFTYHRASNETLSIQGVVSAPISPLLANCSGRGYAYGVARITESDEEVGVYALKDTLKYQRVSRTRLKNIEALLLEHYERSGDWQDMKKYADQLILCNREAYYTLFFYLYDKTDTPGFPYTASQIERALLFPDPEEVEVRNRILFAKWQKHKQAGHWSAEDSLTLSAVAHSGSSVAPLACFELRRHGVMDCPLRSDLQAPIYPVCPDPYYRRASEEKQTTLLTAFPNPASERTLITYRAEQAEQVTLRIVSVTDGTIWQESSLDPLSDQLELDLSRFNAGIYAYTLYLNGEPKRTERLLIVKH